MILIVNNMINHARTLLLNLPSINSIQEEYIPAEYIPLKLPEELQRIHDFLFDPKSLDEMEYQTRQYMTILHGTKLEKYVLALDSRITYWPYITIKSDQEKHFFVEDDVVIFKDLIDAAGLLEQFPEFENIYNDTQRNIYKIGAMLLVFIYRLNELHNAVGKH